MERKPTIAGPRPAGNRNRMWWLVGIVSGVIVLANVSRCSPSASTRTAADVATSDPTIKGLNLAIASQPPPTLQALNSGSVKAGFADMRVSVAAEGLSGAMIYSQNCYDALSHDFSWRRLDVCGAADLKAVAAVPEDEIAGLEKEVAYFQNEVAAARYLGAATGGGTTAENADARLEKMQARLPAPKPTIDDHSGIGNAVIDDASIGESNVDVNDGTS